MVARREPLPAARETSDDDGNGEAEGAPGLENAPTLGERMTWVGHMLERIGMDDDIEARVGIGHGVHVDLRIGREDVPGEPAEHGVEAAGFVHLEHGKACSGGR